MVDHGKRKKFHDKDKYYRLAKEQGLRSRAAFKLSQINRKFPVLEKSQTAVLDLCAAPGGWTQICARTCPSSTQIIAVDILPIRSLRGGNNNITTIVGDITTEKCKADIKRAVAGSELSGLVDVVLHDGAPNVGADYSKDAYEQNEIAVHALRCATQHLKPNGVFITKIYRSRDYASYHWVLQQLFDSVDAFKPKASRQQSAEIFLVAQGYKAPAKLDARLLDPKHIFENFEGQTTGGSTTGSATGAAPLSVFHKNYEKLAGKRHRGGYDMEHLDFSMRHVVPVIDFVQSSGMNAAIGILSNSTGMRFNCDVCNSSDVNAKKESTPTTCACHSLLHHALTTPEVKEYVSDLQVLNKTDFKGLIQWRSKMQEALEARAEALGDDDGDDERNVADDDEAAGADTTKDDNNDSEREEEEIQAEIEEMRQRRLREKKKIKKKERAAAGKRRRHAALGMDLNAIDIPEHDKLFSLAEITTKGDLAAASEVNLDQVTDEQIFGTSNDDDIVIEGTMDKKKDDDDIDDDDEAAARLRQRERELDEAYETYLQSTKDGLAKSGTKMQKRSKKSQRIKIVQEASEDQEMLLSAPSGIGHDTKAYARMLQGGGGSKDSDDSDDDDDKSDSDGDSSGDEDDDDDGFHANPMTPQEHAAYVRSKKKQSNDSNPLIHKFNDPASAKTARWFSNPLFESIGKATESAATQQHQQQQRQSSSRKRKESDDDDDDMSSDGSDSDDSEDEKAKVVAEKTDGKKKKPVKEKKSTKGMDADEVLAMMPKTDKQVRHEKRLKQMARDERKKARREKGNEDPAFELAPGQEDDDDNDEQADEKLKNMSDSKRKKVLEARDQIKAGMGKAYGAGGAAADDDTGFEVVSREEHDDSVLPIKDDRKYDSDHEDYDSDDYAETLALGTMILRRSKEKALVDASYNRYAWNDPPDLPEWFVDDEKKHHRPQLPIPPALLAKMKEKMMAQAVKPIAKVAEARARKSKRARAKLAAAKKQAEAVANSSEMSEAMKLKAVSKALRGQDNKRPGKTYVLAKKGRGMTGGGGKGVKVVDKRMKSDKRGAERAEKKRKKGKQGGLVGSKKRRHHR